MDPFTMAARLLGDLPLTSGQLAQLRAINTKYFTALAGPEGASAAGAAALRAMIAADIRDMLTEEQRVAFDRNLPHVLPAAGET